MHDEVKSDSPVCEAAGRLDALLKGIKKLHSCWQKKKQYF